MNGDLVVDGQITSSNANFSTNVTITGTFDVDGISTFSNVTNFLDNINVGVGANATFEDTVYMNSNLEV